MLKRMYFVVSFLSFFTIINGMDQELGKRSGVGAFLDGKLNALLDAVENQVSSHVATLENQVVDVADQMEQKLSSLDPKMVWNALIVCGAVCGTLEGFKWACNRYGRKSDLVVDAGVITEDGELAQATSKADKLVNFVSKQQVDAMVQAKWDELIASGKFADKDYVAIIQKQIINSITQSLETTASRVTVIEKEVAGLKGLEALVKADASQKKEIIVTAHETLSNRVAALENIYVASSSSSAFTKNAPGIFSKLLKKNKTRDDNANHPASDAHSQGNRQDGDEDHATTVTLHTPGELEKNNDDTL